jgi:hypothetical protein
MKTKIGLVLILLILLFSSVTLGAVISIISEDYSVSASYFYHNWGDYPNDNFSDSLSGNTPLTIYHAYSGGEVMSSVSPFRVEALLYPGWGYNGEDHDTSGNAFASGSWIFKPLVDELRFQSDYFHPFASSSSAWGWLQDMDTGVYVLDVFPGNNIISQTVDQTHSYLLYMQVYVSGSNIYDHIILDVSITPEPATLLFLTLGGLVLRRRKA